MRRGAAKDGASGGQPPHGGLDDAVRQGLTLHQAGRRQEAETIYRQVLARRGDHAPAQHFLGLLMHQTGRSAEGLTLMERSLKSEPNNADFLNNLGTVQRDLGATQAAAASFRKAVAARPDSLAMRDDLGATEKLLGRFEVAEHVFRGTISRSPFHMRARLGLADTLQEAGRTDEAITALSEALAIRPKDADLLHLLGVALMEKGRIDEAAEKFRAALVVNPDRAVSWQLLSLVKLQRQPDVELKAMEALHGRVPAGSIERMQLSFGLGKAHDDLKDYNRAFDFFAEGNRIRRAGIVYDGEETRADFAAIKSAFSKEFVEKHRPSGIEDNSPVFIVGMPRSGTTLVEQILASHPQVFGAGELTILRTVVAKAFPLNAKGGFPVGLAGVKDKAFADAGQDYLDMLRARYPRHRHITDKMPGNFLLIGFLHLMLPKAKIVHCARGAAATCLSIYKTHFRADGHLYGYDLEELADFHNLYTDMMAHWRVVLPGVVHDVQYEDFVADQEGQSRALIDWLGLPWNDQVLAFQNADRGVRTASAAQVRQPMYKGSVNLWRGYGDRLKPLLERLK